MSRRLWVDVVAEGQLAEIAAVEGQQDAAQEAAEHDAAGALVGGEVVAWPWGSRTPAGGS
jgi:hypothetical protein